MKALTVSLRCLLRFLVVTAVVDRDLSAAVPAVANRPMTGLPKGVDAATVVALLASCDRSTAVGVRNYAIVTLPASSKDARWRPSIRDDAVPSRLGWRAKRSPSHRVCRPPRMSTDVRFIVGALPALRLGTSIAGLTPGALGNAATAYRQGRLVIHVSPLSAWSVHDYGVCSA